MRDPTEGMADAAWKDFQVDFDPRRAWSVMIAAALGKSC
jgi:hypothetical protein